MQLAGQISRHGIAPPPAAPGDVLQRAMRPAGAWLAEMAHFSVTQHAMTSESAPSDFG
jgi:hypothetical protein